MATQKRNPASTTVVRCTVCGIANGERDAYVYLCPILDVNLCIQCAHREAYPKFIRERTEPDSKDKEILTAQLELLRKGGDPIFPMQGLQRPPIPFEWSSLLETSLSRGDKWEHYIVEICNVVIGQFSEPNTEILYKYPTSCLLVPDDNDPRKVIWMKCRARVFYKSSLAYVEIRFSDQTHSSIDIKNIKDIKGQDELIKVWEGLGTYWKKMRKHFGRYDDGNQFRDKAVNACVSLYEDFEDTRFPTEMIAERMLLGKTSLYDYAKEFGFTLRQIRETARNLIVQKYLRK